MADEAYGAHNLAGDQRSGRHPLLGFRRQNSKSVANFRPQMHGDHPSPYGPNQRHRCQPRRRSALHGLRRRHRQSLAPELLPRRTAGALADSDAAGEALAREGLGSDSRGWGGVRRVHGRVRALLGEGVVGGAVAVRRCASGSHARRDGIGERGEVCGQWVRRLHLQGLEQRPGLSAFLRGGPCGPPWAHSLRLCIFWTRTDGSG